MKIGRGDRGVAVLPMVLLIGGIIFEVAIVGAFVVYYGQQTGGAFQQHGEATAAAEAGIQDALMRVIRDNAFSGTYQIEWVGWTVTVTVDNGITQKTVVSTAKKSLFGGGKSLTAVLDVDTNTTRVNLGSVTETPVP